MIIVKKHVHCISNQNLFLIIKITLGKDLVFIKVYIALWSFLILLQGCSMSQTFQPALRTVDPQCFKNLKSSIAILTNLPDIKISKDMFTKSAYLVFSNHPKFSYGMNDRLVGVRGSEKILMLYLKEGKCYVGLLDQKKNIVKNVVLNQCNCTKAR